MVFVNRVWRKNRVVAGLCPAPPLETFLEKSFKTSKNFDRPKLRFGKKTGRRMIRLPVFYNRMPQIASRAFRLEQKAPYKGFRGGCGGNLLQKVSHHGVPAVEKDKMEYAYRNKHCICVHRCYLSICLATLGSIYLPCGKFDMFSLRSNSIGYKSALTQ